MSNCILFTGYIAPDGYGYIYSPDTKRSMGAHRKTFKDHHGYYPKVVMHICDNRACVNVEHLVAGDWSKNTLDCISKGRFNYANRKLTITQSKEIRLSRESQRSLAKRYGVSQDSINDIQHGRTYKDE